MDLNVGYRHGLRHGGALVDTPGRNPFTFGSA
jgi:hypothetical protein